MKFKDKTAKEKQEMILGIIEGRLLPIPEHTSRREGKFHKVDRHIRKQINPFKEFMVKPTKNT